jgi:hypothetical protein
MAELIALKSSSDRWRTRRAAGGGFKSAPRLRGAAVPGEKLVENGIPLWLSKNI